ncbi:DUF4166 domain-containing protein [Roseibium salinum]|nr:DUF4166 domain-containing protein [Roseibium salinum]
MSGWSGLRKRRLGRAGDGGLPPRWSSFIGAPDLILFPDHYGARTVLFRAGLELPLMHLGLWGLSWLVRLGLIRSLEHAAKALQWTANRLKPLGTDRGGMEVRVCGSDLQGRPLSRCWTLIAEAGDGPHIPAVAATVLCERISGDAVQPGARPCLGEFTLREADAAMAPLNVRTFMSADTRPTLFQQVLGDTFANLPQPIQALHTVYDRRHWAGQAKVTRGRSLLGNLLCRMVGFPPEAAETPVSVGIDRHQDGETWRRCFGSKAFTSHLCARDDTGSGHIRERSRPGEVRHRSSS